MDRQSTRILCVDDHGFLIEGLRARFELEGDLEIVAQLDSANDLVATVARLRPDVVLLDIEIPGVDPFDAAKEVARRNPDSRVIFLSAFVRDHYISQATESGAWGYFSKSDEISEIIDGIRRVAGGAAAFGAHVRTRCGAGQKEYPTSNSEDAPISKLSTLTRRELEVLRMIGRGMNRIVIADALQRSPKTIDGHRDKLMRKLDLHSRADLVRFAVREGLVEE